MTDETAFMRYYGLNGGKDDGFVEETAFNRTETKWEGIMKIAKSRRYIFVYLSQHSAHVIPRRAFTNDSQWELLYQKLMAYTTKKDI